jgi:ABC-type branched-subunit amino acid transport system permease subunit
MGVVAVLLPFLFMSLINHWQSTGVDVREYFYSIDTGTMEVLSGVPADQLHPNPARDLFTGEYPEDRPLRTNPMRLTFGKEAGLELLGANLRIGGFYGFMILLAAVGVISALLTWEVEAVDLDRYRKRADTSLATSQYAFLVARARQIAHWGALLLPLVFFALLWLTVGHGAYNANTDHYSWLNPVISLGSSGQDVQLLIGFGVILFALVAVRAARPDDWGLSYQARLSICLGVVTGMIALGLWRILDSKTYFIAVSGAVSDNRTLCALVAILVGAALAAQNGHALRREGRFETQLAGTLGALVVLMMPLYLNRGQNDVMTIVGIYVMLGLGLNIVVGYAGLLDLGYVAFFALGAYAYAFLSSNQLRFAGNDATVVRLSGWIVITILISLIVICAGVIYWQRHMTRPPTEARPSLIAFPGLPPRGVTTLITVAAIMGSMIIASILGSLGMYQDVFGSASPFLVGIIVGVMVAGLSGIALGIPVLRLRGDYLAIVTLGFGEIIRIMFNNLRDYTGGPQGVLEIPRPMAGAANNLSMIYLVFIGAGVVAFVSTRLKTSRTGRAWSAMRSDEDIAQSMGINLVRSKLMAFAIGAAFGGVGGVMFATRQRGIFPKDFDLNVSIEVLSLVIIGGMGSIPGVIMGAIALIGVPEVLRELETYRILVFGALLVTMVILRPEGLLPAPTPQLRERARALAQPQDGGD